MDVLREEIRETEKTRNDLFKWKLGLVGTLGAAGLGFAGSQHLHHADLVLAAIPPVSLYVDLLCRNLAVKMLVIGTFFRTLGSESRDGDEVQILSAYEGHVELARKLTLNWSDLKWRPSSSNSNAFALEDEALGFATFALSLGGWAGTRPTWRARTPGIGWCLP